MEADVHHPEHKILNFKAMRTSNLDIISAKMCLFYVGFEVSRW
jgi:hypothetical protein